MTWRAVIQKEQPWIGPHGRIRTCDECGETVPPLEMWQQSVEGGAGMAYGHRRPCIEAMWGSENGSTGGGDA